MKMKPSSELRMMARRIKRHGFGLGLGRRYGANNSRIVGPCCFIGAWPAVNDIDVLLAPVWGRAFGRLVLIKHGFTAPDGDPAMTRDAVAMCEMAADILETQGQ